MPLEVQWLECASGKVPLFRRGSQDMDRQLLIVPPLLEEANRCRRLSALLQMALARHGVGASLIDLPGTGESEASLGDVGIDDWFEALTTAIACIGGRPVLLSIRGGSLVAAGAASGLNHIALAPVEDGRKHMRFWMRSSIAASDELGLPMKMADFEQPGEPPALLGYTISRKLLAALDGLQLNVAETRFQRIELVEDADEAQASGSSGTIYLQGPRVWRQPEPEPSDALAEALARTIIADWPAA